MYSFYVSAYLFSNMLLGGNQTFQNYSGLASAILSISFFFFFFFFFFLTSKVCKSSSIKMIYSFILL